jgi:hypothetical protein
MTPFIHNNNWVSDAEEDSPPSSPHVQTALVPRTGNFLIRHTKQLWGHITCLRPSGCTVPSIGQACLIVKGKTGVDEGQVGVVSDTAAAMVWVTYRHDHHGRRVSKLKRPSSLIMLDPGVVVSQDDNGTIWVRPLAATRGLESSGSR